MAFYFFEDTSVQQVLYSVTASIMQYLRKMYIVTLSSYECCMLICAANICHVHKVNNLRLNKTWINWGNLHAPYANCNELQNCLLIVKDWFRVKT